MILPLYSHIIILTKKIFNLLKLCNKTKTRLNTRTNYTNTINFVESTSALKASGRKNRKYASFEEDKKYGLGKMSLVDNHVEDLDYSKKFKQFFHMGKREGIFRMIITVMN